MTTTEITATRLSAFAADTHNRLVAEDRADQFKSLRRSLEASSGTLAKELGDVSGALATQKGKTLTVDGIMDSFKDTMSDLEGVIAHVLGGFGTPAYLGFYPAGVNEYRRATKAALPTLMQRVSEMAGKDAGALGPAMTAQLQSFATDWNKARDEQQQQKGSVAGNRSERSAARIAVELALLSLIHTVAAAFPGDVDTCRRYFDFGLLEAGRHTSREKGDDTANETENK